MQSKNLSRMINRIQGNPSNPVNWLSLANRLVQLSRLPEAENILLQAVNQCPQDAQIWLLLAEVSRDMGRFNQAVFAAWKSEQSIPSTRTEALFAQGLNHVNFTEFDPVREDAINQALVGGWGKPSEMAEHSIRTLKLNPTIRNLMQDTAAQTSDRANPNVSLESALPALNNNALLLNLLTHAPVCDIQFELLLTNLRRQLLGLSRKSLSSYRRLLSALAQQCFINEYVYETSEAELIAVGLLLDNLEGSPCEEILLLIACYRPISTLDLREDTIHYFQSKSLAEVIKQQNDEPAEEQSLMMNLESVTGIDDGVSSIVQSMYEENPYPRWVSHRKSIPEESISDFFAHRLPFVKIERLPEAQALDILVAGGGTGQHPIETARRFANANVLAVDLSKRSLAYAQRKANELGLKNLRFAQADILFLEDLNQQFDLIESAGVLHHMENPWRGWDSLISCLKPNGVMMIGLYSAIARKNINRVREFVRGQGYRHDVNTIRDARPKIVQFARENGLEEILRFRDFYSSSGCRDLLFHVQEHQMSLGDIRSFIEDRGLTFIGFDLNKSVIEEYRRIFPTDIQAIDLQNWEKFEKLHPNTFVSMYQFWVQKDH
jgi:SAM-dependent methyltransferase